MALETSQPAPIIWTPEVCMRALGLEPIEPVGSYKDTPIDYIEIAPKPIEIQIPLVEFFERIKRVRADRWQVHFCNYLQGIVENRHIHGSFEEFHAEPQLGKTSILSQAFPAWKLGHDPFWREILAMYNISRSEAHSEVIIQIMRSVLYREIFPNTDSHLPSSVSKSGWSTNARLDAENGRLDGQRSFSPVGLGSGITGSGADSYTIDDPYKEPSEAWSEAVRTALDLFWKFGIEPRLTPYSCVAAMFHRYTYDDFGGYLLNTGKFKYVRYATIADGPYVHEETGQSFPDPLDREIGEYISPERRPPSYYTEKKKDPRVWNSMFQGRPSSQTGEFFNVGRIRDLKTLAEIEAARKECVFFVRAYDLAATAGGGDHTAGALMGIKPNLDVVVFDMILGQLGADEVAELQKATAQADGPDVTICIPKERAQAGKSLVYFAEQMLKGYNVVSRDVVNDAPGSNAKVRRAYNASVAVNSGQFWFASDDHLPEEKKWVETVKRAMRTFPLSSFDDPIDAMGDGYNQLFEQMTRGLIMRSFAPQRNLVGWKQFAKVYGDKIPKAWQVYVGVKITNEENRANSALIVARASENTHLKDTLFVIAEYKKYTADYYALFDWIRDSLELYCEKPKAALISLDAESSETYGPVIRQKLKRGVAAFDQDELAGIAESNWYMMPREGTSPFGGPAAGLYALVADDQIIEPTNELGLYNLRQEAATWGYNDKGAPTAIGSVLDCLRMTTFRFRTMATGLTQTETVEAAMPKAYTIADMLKKTGRKHLTDTQQIARELMEQEVREKLGMTERERPEWAEDFIEDGRDLESWEKAGGY